MYAKLYNFAKGHNLCPCYISFLFDFIPNIIHEGQVRKLELEPQEKDDKMREAQNEKVENEESGPDKNVDSQIEPMKASDIEKQGQAGESPSDQVKYKASQFDA